MEIGGKCVKNFEILKKGLKIWKHFRNFEKVWKPGKKFGNNLEIWKFGKFGKNWKIGNLVNWKLEIDNQISKLLP